MPKRYKVILLCIGIFFCLFVALPILCWAKPWSHNGYYTQPWVLDSMNPMNETNKYMRIDGSNYGIYMTGNNRSTLYKHGTIRNIQPETMTWTDQQGHTSTVKFIFYSYQHSQGISKIYNPFKLFLIKWYELNSK